MEIDRLTGKRKKKTATRIMEENVIASINKYRSRDNSDSENLEDYEFI